MKMRTLREVYEEIGVSRTTLQGWVNGILEKPTLQDDTGWYFDDIDFEKIWQIRFFKQLKYKNSQIKEILNNPDFDKKKCLKEQISLLTREKDELENLISAACLMSETGISPKTIRFEIGEFGIIKEKNFYKSIVSIIGTAFNLFYHFEDENIDYFNEEEIESRFDVFEKIMIFCKKGMDISSEEVQFQVSLIPEAVMFKLYFSPDSEIAAEIDKDYGTGKAAYFYNALQYYCNVNNKNEIGKELYTALENIADYGIKRFTANSDEVQQEVKKLFQSFKVLSEKGKLAMLENLGALYGSKAIKDVVDHGASRGICWFISRAIQIYCDKLK